jgi:hypothetical protein
MSTQMTAVAFALVVLVLAYVMYEFVGTDLGSPLDQAPPTSIAQ